MLVASSSRAASSRELRGGQADHLPDPGELRPDPEGVLAPPHEGRHGGRQGGQLGHQVRRGGGGLRAGRLLGAERGAEVGVAVLLDRAKPNK